MEIVGRVRDYPNFIDRRGRVFRKRLQAEAGDLAGLAVSNGTYTGRAKVLKTPCEKRLEPGEILVTVATEPSWTPVFVNASAVVLEVDGTNCIVKILRETACCRAICISAATFPGAASPCPGFWPKRRPGHRPDLEHR